MAVRGGGAISYVRGTAASIVRASGLEDELKRLGVRFLRRIDSLSACTNSQLVLCRAQID